MAKRYHAGDLGGAVELQKVLAAADPVVAGLGTCMLILYSVQKGGEGMISAKVRLTK